ncbi:hypothetical protein [Corynebacterium sp. A21]|uniref:hypothetical protein n=1 Tax=Corynebacterium sp. A21 TaxID=3457318 RepID=UPI003FD19CE8
MKKWSTFEHFSYSDKEQYLGTTPKTGVHTVFINGTPLDLLIEDRGATTTLVMFHAALSNSAIRIPAFKGLGVAKDSNVNLISVADPTIALGDIDLAWFLGNSTTGYLPPIFAELISHALESLQTKLTILFGTSGGGYAAVNFGEYFPDCIVLAAVPRLDLTAKPDAKLSTYLSVAHKASNIDDLQSVQSDFIRKPLWEKYKQNGLNFDLCLFQNLGDTTFLQYQVIPFIDQLSTDPRLHTRVEWYGRSHIIIPGKPYREIIRTLACNQDRKASIVEAGFSSVIQDMSILPE